MKKLLLIALVATVGFGINEAKLTEEEREKAIEHLTESRDKMMEVIEDLSSEQLNYKPSPEAWSIAECVEHLAISEHSISDMFHGTLSAMADPARRAEVQMNDEQVLQLITDRSSKIKTSEAFEPSGKYGSFESTVEAFNTKREAHIEYLKETEDDLRNHYSEMPFGTIDSYQVLLFMSGHTERHTEQMKEIMEDDGFPEE